MLGQLSWDGVVHPIAEVTWENVLGTARRMQGLDVNEEFFVTYKDEDGDVINVKNDVDLAEAVRWAQEMRVPCLCLQVPFSSEESDSDESWTEVGDKANSSSDPAEVEERPMVDDEADVSVQDTDDSADDLVNNKDAPADEGNTPDVAVHQTTTVDEEERVPTPAAETAIEQPQTPVVEVTPIAEVFSAAAPLEVTPITTVFVEEAAKFEKAPSAEVETFSSSPAKEETEAVSPTLTVEKIITTMCFINDPNREVSSQVDKSFFLELLSEPAAVVALARLLEEADVAAVVSAVAQTEAANSGNAQRTATTQLIKAMYKNPKVIELLGSVPKAEEVLLRVLRGLAPKVKDTETQSKVTHSRVVCDGCKSDASFKQASILAGFQNANEEILGIRYKSAVLPDYDLCESCEASGRFLTTAGPFLKITDPEQAPELILCVMPGATAGMMSQVESLDWRNPLAKEFFGYVKERQQRAFPQQRQTPAVVVAADPVVVQPVAVEEPKIASAPAAPVVEAVVAPSIKCKHPLKRFEVRNDTFTCDLCNQRQAVGAFLHGCRTCNFDSCDACFNKNGLVSVPAAPQPAPAQAKFVSDLTLTDGCAVRPGEKLDKIWRVRNSGPEAWAKGTRIAHVGGDAFGGPSDGVEVPLARPGEVVNISVPLVMPSQPGRYTSYWRMMTPAPASAKFGHRFWVTVNVMAPAPPANVVRAPATMPPASFAPPPPPVAFVPLPALPPAPSAPSPFALRMPGSPALPGPAVLRRPVPPPPPPRPDDVEVPDDLVEPVSRIIDIGITADLARIVRVLKEVNGNTSEAMNRLLEEA